MKDIEIVLFINKPILYLIQSLVILSLSMFTTECLIHQSTFKIFSKISFLSRSRDLRRCDRIEKRTYVRVLCQKKIMTGTSSPFYFERILLISINAKHYFDNQRVND